MLRLATLIALLLTSLTAPAVVLEGTGMATIVDGDLETARIQAREAALRDVALQYDVRVSSEDLMENGRVTHSRLTVASSAKASNVQILDERQLGNILRITLQADMSDNPGSCQGGENKALKKRVAVTGFALQNPTQARSGRLDDAGEALPSQLQAALQASGELQVLRASRVLLYEDVPNAPTSRQFDNRLTNVVEVARELGAQFVVTGVIRDLGFDDPSAWGSSLVDRLGRIADPQRMSRRFVVDLAIFDGFSGSPVYQKRFQTRGTWDAGQGKVRGFGAAAFANTTYGREVARVIEQMGTEVQSALACQPFMTRITRVEGQKVTIESGATAGLRPGDSLALYRSHSHFDSLGDSPELLDADIEVTLDSVFPEYANGRIPRYGALENVQRGDIAIIW